MKKCICHKLIEKCYWWKYLINLEVKQVKRNIENVLQKTNSNTVDKRQNESIFM